MLVDLILDRRDGVSYSPSEFEEEVKEYCETFPSYIPVYNALIDGSEDDVKEELCRYIDDEWGENSLIKDYIKSVSWKKQDLNKRINDCRYYDSNRGLGHK